MQNRRAKLLNTYHSLKPETKLLLDIIGLLMYNIGYYGMVNL